MYESNNKKEFLTKFNEFLLAEKKDLFNKKLAVKKNTRDFAYFKHSNNLKKIL